MPAESWQVMMQAATPLLLCVAISLTWVVYRRCLRFEQTVEPRWLKLRDELRGIERRLTALESMERVGMKPRGRVKPGSSTVRKSTRVDSKSESKLIAVPNLEASPHEADGAINGIKERHATIWALADSGATAEFIARSTGQPIGQIELVLGLRRRIDETKTASPQAQRA
jgi:hypothetical protein